MAITFVGCSKDAGINPFSIQWPVNADRTWVGPELWANRLQDWKVSNGRLECIEGSAELLMRTVHLLTGH